jgi:hypothetical protein
MVSLQFEGILEYIRSMFMRNRLHLPMWNASAVSPDAGNLTHLSNKNLSHKIIGHHKNNEGELLSEALIALFNRVVRPKLTPQHNLQATDAAAFHLTHVMQVCDSLPQPASSTTRTTTSVSGFIRNLARNVVIHRQPTDSFTTIQSAFNLLESPTAEEIFHYNTAVKAENERIDKITSKIHLIGGIGTSVLSVIQGVLAGVSGNNTDQAHNKNSYSDAQVAVMSISALLTVVGGVHSSIESYQNAQKVQPYRPARPANRNRN